MNQRNSLITKHYIENYKRLVKRSMWRVPNKSLALAEECVQEAYARALKYYSTFNPKQDLFNKWFEGILRNAINDCRTIEKDRGVSQELTEDDGVELRPLRKEKYLAAVVLKELKENVNKSVLTMFLVYGFKTVEISEYLNIKHGTVRQIIYRFRNNMNEFLMANHI